MIIKVHPLTHSPTKVWEEISAFQKVIRLKAPLVPDVKPSNKVRVVCMSDTHSKTNLINFNIPKGDIFIHAGDFSRRGEENHVEEFNTWIGTLPHIYKIVIAGNHEFSFDPKFSQHYPSIQSAKQEETQPEINSQQEIVAQMKDKLTNCKYLQDQEVDIEGIKIYGSPWTPEHLGGAFNCQRGQECLEKWESIPKDIDILVTHGPPLGHGDQDWRGQRAGCVELLAMVQYRVKPKFHIFGHIHEGYGITSDGTIVFINAATCNIRYIPVNHPIVFDIDVPNK